MVIHRHGCRLYTREEEYKCLVLDLLYQIKDSVKGMFLVTIPLLEVAGGWSI